MTRPEDLKMTPTNSLTRRDFLAAGLAAAAWPAVPSLVAATDRTGLTLREAADLVRSRTASPVELTRVCLDRIATLNPKVNAYITVTRDAAERQARELEADQRAGRWRGPLHGVPIALKDNIDTAGVRTTGASELF